jgi:hypothetical protein
MFPGEGVRLKPKLGAEDDVELVLEVDCVVDVVVVAALLTPLVLALLVLTWEVGPCDRRKYPATAATRMSTTAPATTAVLTADLPSSSVNRIF